MNIFETWRQEEDATEGPEAVAVAGNEGEMTSQQEGFAIGEQINKITDDIAEETHAVQSTAVLLGVSLLILTIVTIWQFKRCRVRFIHETGMSIVYETTNRNCTFDFGLSIEAFDVLGGRTSSFLITSIHPVCAASLSAITAAGIIAGAIIHYSSSDTKELEASTTFEPALFFYMLLPPIIFAAGYQVQKKHFFRNIGPILLFAFAGTIISTLFIGFATYFIVWLDINSLYDVLGIHDCLQFGALISAVDP
ncbi:hypothetical protein SARC_14272, partial [Sphaeroforma arctica JP610]